ncbi:MAG TPA: NAD(P)-dependent oxidoreductase [Candidatus Methylomirabilis sp.]|nr:NAD(P)-dependent oxidoreductase [Candidatus Methylomirabilis sp.]
MHIVFPDGAACMRDPSELEPLHRLGGRVDFYDGPPPDKASLIERVRPAEAVVLDYSEMDAPVLRACDRLRLITFLGIGYASCIDVDEATRRGVAIAYTPDYGATSVAEHALALILAVTRHIGQAFQSFREGRWEPGRFVGMELRGKTLGLVGLGPIGQEMARLGAGIGMELIAWTRRATPERAIYGLRFVSLEDLFCQADVVSLHLSYRPESHGIVSRALLDRMKRTAFFVNSARAKLVDNTALAEILAAGKIAGAAIDVHEEEPPRGEYVFRTLPNVLITPHIGYNTHEASANMLRIAIDTVVAYARGDRLHVVNGM